MNYLKLLVMCWCLMVPCLLLAQVSDNTHIADSLDLEGEYDQSLKFRKLALNENTHSGDFMKVIRAKYYYTLSCSSEIVGGQDRHSSALENSLKARDYCQQLPKESHLYLKHLVQNRIYHQYGYLGKWDKALVEAEKNLEIVLDTFPEHHQKVLYIIDDLGFIHTKMGDPERANAYYERSNALYKTHHPENLFDVYANYDRVVENYKKLGLRREEFRLLSDAEQYWEKVSTHEDAFSQRFVTYRKLADWYSFYGDYKLAENYLQKQEHLLDSMSLSHKKSEQKTLDRRDLWQLYAAYIDIYYQTNEQDKAKKYIGLSENLLKESTRYYMWDVEGEINLYYLQSQLPELSDAERITYLNKAITLATESEAKFYTDPTPYQLALFRLLAEQKRNTDALKLSEVILSKENLSDHQKFQVLCEEGAILSRQMRSEDAVRCFDEAMQCILKTPNTDYSFSSLKPEQLKEFYTYETLDGLLMMGTHFLKHYQKTSEEDDFKSAYNLFMLTSELFNQIYIGDMYNSKLYKSYKDIEKGLISCGMLKQESTMLSDILQTLENNTSKLTWSKFVYSKSKQRLNIPDSILYKELELKSLINYYQNKLYTSKQESGLSSDSLSHRITDLKTQLRKQQQAIQQTYEPYYHRSQETFDLEGFKKQLDTDQVAYKFVFVESDLFVFQISKTDCKLKRLNEDDDVATSISTYVNALSKFDSEVVIPEAMKPLVDLMNESQFDDITIIAGQSLAMLPFEALMDDYFESDKVISYSSSLKLYAEQLKVPSQKDLLVGIFTGQSENQISANYLPAVMKEVSAIGDIVPSQLFQNATKHEFIEKSPEFNILHLAMHSGIDLENPEFSHLDFSGERLLVGELYNETLNADLAVLSACDTGFGMIYNGEGVQSVSKAFTYAGVPSTVMSLWKVDDKATASIMASFYKHLDNGAPKHRALKLAKRDYLNSEIDEALKHPYYWSGFVISGNVDAFKSSANGYWWLLLLLVPVIGFVVYRRL
ncbi:CHAT domain-containing protein [Subsaxibacter sp. CAU 1640]|uniref:CHAT domain-containing protein n=1 Tax=Subsaxibacter sp. CAU 1640 TaxID=2933271 RepID=UPI00200579DC|nr:CHAT domain-containing tetratricopeptide repeat protein [Subsaxibacter sp. CAU 1640]MCK7590772.1 CHAT domain-containing protein [Subsaxibacter sp. CAU 1640]